MTYIWKFDFECLHEISQGAMSEMTKVMVNKSKQWSDFMQDMIDKIDK